MAKLRFEATIIGKNKAAWRPGLKLTSQYFRTIYVMNRQQLCAKACSGLPHEKSPNGLRLSGQPLLDRVKVMLKMSGRSDTKDSPWALASASTASSTLMESARRFGAAPNDFTRASLVTNSVHRQRVVRFCTSQNISLLSQNNFFPLPPSPRAAGPPLARPNILGSSVEKRKNSQSESEWVTSQPVWVRVSEGVKTILGPTWRPAATWKRFEDSRWRVSEIGFLPSYSPSDWNLQVMLLMGPTWIRGKESSTSKSVSSRSTQS